MPYPASYGETRGGRAAYSVSVSCCLSAAGIRFSGRPFPLGSYAFLTVSRPDLGPDPNGVSTFHTSEIRPGWVPPLPRGGGVHLAGGTSTGQRLPLRNGQPCTPLEQPISEAWDHEA